MAKVEAWGYEQDGETHVPGSYATRSTRDTDAGIDAVCGELMADERVRQVAYYVDGEHFGTQALLTFG